MARALFFSILLCSVSLNATAQINAYAKVTSISGSVLTLSNVTETYHTFEDGDMIVIMQMQDNVIGANTTDASTFGNLSAIGSAGLYEVKTIASHTEVSSLPATITISGTLSNTYSTGANSSVQIISFRKYGSPNYTTTANMIALPWDGNVGGVLAMQVDGILTLAHNITANSSGFRGGARSPTAFTTGDNNCSTIWSTNDDRQGEKGEGIYKRTDANYQYGRAKILNGGGGGNYNNAGGGGGGNYTAGGLGGIGWSCGSNVGGQGGIDLSTSISASRIFMGGGGGGGQHDGYVGTAGGNGGGIILLRADQVVTTGACGGRVISANGGTATNSDYDGAGGGGAAGGIILDVDAYAVVATCALSVQASGGNGGSVGNASVHGGGGGGGQGKVIYSIAQPTTNITTVTNNGSGGCNNMTCSSSANSAAGSNGSGISGNSGVTPLPVTLLRFLADYNRSEKSVLIKWATATEKNHDAFVLEKSRDATVFFPIETIQGTGNSFVEKRYVSVDTELWKGIIYYRLKQIDFDNTITYSRVISIHIDEEFPASLTVFPNPVKEDKLITIILTNLPSDAAPQFQVYDLNGIAYPVNMVSDRNHPHVYYLSCENLPVGIIFLRVRAGTLIFNRKLTVQNSEK